jgi:hypothetical protein
MSTTTKACPTSRSRTESEHERDHCLFVMNRWWKYIVVTILTTQTMHAMQNAIFMVTSSMLWFLLSPLFTDHYIFLAIHTLRHKWCFLCPLIHVGQNWFFVYTRITQHKKTLKASLTHHVLAPTSPFFFCTIATASMSRWSLLRPL